MSLSQIVEELSRIASMYSARHGVQAVASLVLPYLLSRSST